VVASDPADLGNLVLSVTTDSTRLYKELRVLKGTVRMLFLRFRFEGQQNYSFGMSDLSRPTEFDDYEVELSMSNAMNDFLVNDDGSYVVLTELEPQVWYNCWILINHFDDEFQVWLHDRSTEPATAAGHLTLQPVECAVEELLRASVRNNRELAERRGVKLSYEIPKGLPSITLDPEKIRTSIGHLIDNAVKFSPPGTVVKVSARVVPSSEEDDTDDGLGFVLMATPDMLEISVEDFGAGIEDADLGRIFSPFTQLDASSTREHGGAGLGLAIVKHYVEAHGGRVKATSSVGEGSRFAIRLPLTESA